jgi:hypothetical protein
MINMSYDWTLTFAHVVDGVTVGPTGTLDVAGTITGLLSEYGSTLSNTYTNGPIGTPLTVIVDGQPIMVQLDAWTPPGTPSALGSSSTPTLNFSVSLLPGSNGQFQPVPEPGTFVLLGIGGVVVLAPRLRRGLRRKA